MRWLLDHLAVIVMQVLVVTLVLATLYMVWVRVGPALQHLLRP